MSRPTVHWARALAGGSALLLAPALLPAQSARRQDSGRPEVRKLVLRGVKHVDRQELASSISTTATKCRSFVLVPFCLVSKSPVFVERHYLDRDEFKRDVLRIRVYYWERGYRDATVDTSIARKGKNAVAVTFDIKENPPTTIRAIAIEYDSTVISPKRRSRLTLLRAGQPLNLVVLDSMRLLWLQEMQDRGYADARVDTSVVVDREARTGAVLLRATPGRVTTVGTIDISGNQKVSKKTILNSMILRPGGLFKRNDLLESERNLYESNLFRQVTVRRVPTTDSVKDISLDVVEAPLHDARAGIGFTTVDFFQIESRYSFYNFLGGGRRLDATATAGNLLAPTLNGNAPFRGQPNYGGMDPKLFLQPTWAVSTDLTQPAFLTQPQNSFSVGVFAHRRQAPSVYVDRGYGATATLTRNFAIRAPGSLNYHFEVTRVEASDVYFCVSYGVCDTLTIGSLRSHQRLSPLSLTGFVDRSDDPFFPTQGYVVRADIQSASALTFSDYRYNRGMGDLAAYWHRPMSRSVVAVHLQVGIVRGLRGSGLSALGVLHPRTRFYSGGANSVRGYGENQLGPRILTVDSAAIRGDSAVANGFVYTRCPLSTPIQQCDPNVKGLRNSDFQPQALGGTSLVLASIEYRFPFLLRNIEGAVFLDGAVVGESAVRRLQDLQNLAKGTGAATPGFGVRYKSPVGPIRVDIGINPKTTENLGVVTAIKVNGQQRIVPLAQARRYSDAGNGLLGRLALHLSIGEPF